LFCAACEMSTSPQKQMAGVGIFFQQEVNGEVFVKNIPPDGPAGKEGSVQNGDQVLMVGDRPVTKLTLMAMRDLIVGPMGTPVKLSLRRKNKDGTVHDFEVSLERGLAAVSPDANKSETTPSAAQAQPSPSQGSPQQQQQQQPPQQQQQRAPQQSAAQTPAQQTPQQPPPPQQIPPTDAQADLPPAWSNTGAKFVEALAAVEDLRVQLNKKIDEAFQRLYEHKNYVERHLEQQHARVERERVLLEQERTQFVNESRQMQTNLKAAPPAAPVPDTVVDLNVGGRTFTTSKATLCQVPGSLLEAMFTGQQSVAKDGAGRYFIDRNPKHFESILEYLRTQKIQPPSSLEERRGLKVEAEFFGLPGLTRMLEQDHRALMSPNGSLVNSQLGAVTSQYLGSTSLNSSGIQIVGGGHPTNLSYSSPGRPLMARDFVGQAQ